MVSESGGKLSVPEVPLLSPSISAHPPIKNRQQSIIENNFILKSLSYIDTRVLLFVAFYK